MTRTAILADLRQSLAMVEEVALAAESDFDRRYAPGKWTAREVAAHVADVELINFWRFARAVAEPGCGVDAFDENAWAWRLAYAQRPARLSLDVLTATRKLLIHQVETSPDDHLSGASLHPEKGPMTGWQWARLICDHTDHHLGQIRAALAGRAWERPAPTADSWKYTGGRAPGAAGQVEQ